MDQDATWAEEEFGDADLGDLRRNARLIQLAMVLGAQPAAALPAARDDPATVKAAYRFFANKYVRADAVLASHIQATSRRMQAVPLVLAVQDTTSLDWTDHPATKGLGPLTAAPIRACWRILPWRSHPTACRWGCGTNRSGLAMRPALPSWSTTNSARSPRKNARNG